MANTRDILRRIRSVKGTQQITKAMKMVAAAKLRRAQMAVTEARPYAEGLRRVLAGVSARTEYTHPLLEQHEGRRAWVVVISSDKGLCGAFNANLLRQIEKELWAGERWDGIELITVGRKASEYFQSREWAVVAREKDMMSSLGPDDGPKLAEMFIKAFSNGQVDRVFLVYNSFVSLIRHDYTLKQLLPIEPPTLEAASEEGALVDYLYEPDAPGLLDGLLPGYVESEVQTALLDSVAAEQAARMTSMDAATRNAGDMIDSLTLLYNRTRQAAITKELIEIVSGAQALG